MLLEIALFFVLIFILIYRFITKDFNFFDGQKNSIAVLDPSFPFGNKFMVNVLKGEINILEISNKVQELYPNDKIIGYFLFQTPRYMINDQELAKLVLIKDFEYFMDRPTAQSGSEVANQFLTNLEGAKWKEMRVLMSGVFTSGKLKLMLPHMSNVGNNFAAYIDSLSESGEEVDIKNAGGLLTMDSIATAGFGIDVNSFKDPNNTFRLMALRLVNAPGHAKSSIMATIIKFMICQAFPRLGKDVLKLTFIDKEALDFFADIVRKAYQHRLNTKQRRNDLIDLIVDELNKANSGAKKEEKQEFEDEFEANSAMNTDDVAGLNVGDTEIVLIANAILFFFAGFETSATGFGAVCHKLALFPDVQEKVYDEITDVFGGDPKITFEKLSALKYLDMCVSEGLRLANAVPLIQRVCTKNYQIPGTDVVIPKGANVNVPTTKMTLDEQNFYNAKEFDPENFNPENKPNKFAFGTFGQGPRNCIGMRYALMILKVGLVSMLMNHKILPGEKMPKTLRLNKQMNHFEGGLPVKFQKR